MRVRSAKIADAKSILEVHRAAVHGTAAVDYPPETLADWSRPINSNRISKFQNTAMKSEKILVVEFKGRVVAFGSLVPEQNELRAVYVAPEFGRQGLGTRVVGALERMARTRGCTELFLHSSLTAERFYRERGYLFIKKTFISLKTGRKLDCVKMAKTL